MPLVAPSEITFNAYQEEDGGYYAVAEGYSIVTQGDGWSELVDMVKDAILCHFDEGFPENIKVNLVEQEVSAV